MYDMTLVLHATFTIAFLPAVFVGILGVMLFWQWTYMTSVYYVSFFVGGRQNAHQPIRNAPVHLGGEFPLGGLIAGALRVGPIDH